MNLIKNFIANALINGLILYLIAKYGPQMKFYGFQIKPLDSLNIETTLILGFIFYFVYSILRRLIKLMTFPISWMTFGLFSIVINIMMLFLFRYLVDSFGLPITIYLGTYGELFILSIIIYLFNLILK